MTKPSKWSPAPLSQQVEPSLHGNAPIIVTIIALIVIL